MKSTLKVAGLYLLAFLFVSFLAGVFNLFWMMP